MIDDDLPIFFVQQLDPDANYMAAFTAPDPTDRAAFAAHWAKIRGDDSIVLRTIVCDGQVAGYVASFVAWGERQVSYWLGKEYWGRGIATTGLRLFLCELKSRPLAARAAKDNLASIRVLEKCGFTITGHDRGVAEARGMEIDEVLLTLAAPSSPHP